MASTFLFHNTQLGCDVAFDCWFYLRSSCRLFLMLVAPFVTFSLLVNSYFFVTDCFLLFCCWLLHACMLSVNCYFCRQLIVALLCVSFLPIDCKPQHFLLSCSCRCCHGALMMNCHWGFMRHQFIDSFHQWLIITFCYPLIVTCCWPNNSPNPLLVCEGSMVIKDMPVSKSVFCAANKVAIFFTCSKTLWKQY